MCKFLANFFEGEIKVGGQCDGERGSGGLEFFIERIGRNRRELGGGIVDRGERGEGGGVFGNMTEL